MICRRKPLDMFVKLRTLLRPIALSVHKLEGDSYPTMSWVQLCADALLTKIKSMLETEKSKSSQRSDTFIVVLEKMLASLQARFSMPLPQPDGYMPIDFIAAALDPATKNLRFLAGPSQELVWTHLTKLASEIVLPNMSEQGITPLNDSNGIHELLQLFNIVQHGDSAEAEVQKYRQIDAFTLDPLPFWKSHELEFPRLAILARNYLAVPASSATVERVFSRAGKVVTPTRTLLSPDIIEAQTMYFINEPFIAHCANTKKRKRNE